MFRYLWSLKPGFLAALAGLILSGCAGGFSKDSSQTAITAEPATAQCALEGNNFSTTVRTPARIELPKNAAPVTLTCGASGHYAFVTTLKPLFNEKVFSNLLLGSITGMIVDMANGHGSKYPERVHVHMEPSSFATIEARDKWYARYEGSIAQKWEQVDAEVINSCKADDDGYDCAARRNALFAKRAEEFKLVEQRRRQAHIDAASTAERPTTLPLTQ